MDNKEIVENTLLPSFQLRLLRSDGPKEVEFENLKRKGEENMCIWHIFFYIFFFSKFSYHTLFDKPAGEGVSNDCMAGNGGEAAIAGGGKSVQVRWHKIAQLHLW